MSLARAAYSWLFRLAMPLVWLRLLWRARRQPEYLHHLPERHGYYAPRPAGPLLWLHAVSVGETRAAAPLIEALLAAHPAHRLLLTHMTPTGRAAAADLVHRYAGRITQAYLPYDLPGASARFLDHFRPALGLLMETEIWPNLLAAGERREIPLALINARLSARSQRGYLRLANLMRPALHSLCAVAAQTAADAERLTQIGARGVRVHGNLKFDVTPPPDKVELGARWRRTIGQRAVWLAASTREGEEELLLDAFAASASLDCLLVLVPRHPQRFDEVATLLAKRGLTFGRRSAGTLPQPQTAIWLGDSMGEMAAYYRLADLALIGGTLLPFGGQNLIEAAACGCPVLLGPHTYNFAQASDDAIACGAAQRVADAGAAVAATRRLLIDPEALSAMRSAAALFSQAHRGATLRTAALVADLMALRTGS